MTRHRFVPATLLVPLLLCFSFLILAAGPAPSYPVVGLSADSTNGEVKGVLISEGTKDPLRVVPDLLRDREEGEDQAEVQRLMNLMENKPDSAIGFHWVNVPPGHYHLFTYQHGIIGEGFDVAAGETVDLGRVEVGEG